MDNPGLSLFQNGVSLQLDTVNQQEREEEEDDKEEQRRIEAELAEKLEGAFDDLDLEDGDESSIYSPPPPQHSYSDLLTPGQVPAKYATSTPFIQDNHKEFQTQDENLFRPLAVEETTFDGGPDDYGDYGRYQAGQGQDYGSQNRYIDGHDNNYVGHHFAGDNGGAVQYNTEQSGRYSKTVQFPDQLNKSDTEKVRERSVGEKPGEQSDLMVLYTARGREIERLEAEIKKIKADHTSQIRQLSHRTATTAMDKQQMEQLLGDSRRENQLLRDELYTLRETTEKLKEEKDGLEREHEGDREAVTQLQKQLQLLQTSDTVLKARQQHDAVVRSMKERHENEVQKLRVELDTVKSSAKEKDREYNILRDKFVALRDDHDYSLKEKTRQIEELSDKLAASKARVSELSQSDQSSKIHRLESDLEQMRRTNIQLEQQISRLHAEISSLKLEVAGYEAINPEEASDSILSLGLSTSSKPDGGLRLKEELHRSLTGNKSKREEISRLEKLLSERETEVLKLNTELREVVGKLKVSEELVSASINQEEELGRLRKEVEELKPRNLKLQNNLAELEKQNIEVKKCMTAMLENNNEDKMEAIDSLREEYEEHCRNAVEQTKSLMEGEVRRLKIELDVYNKTVLELRKKLDLKTNMAEVKSSNLSTADEKTIKTLEEKLSSALDENKELSVKVEKLTDQIYKLETIEKEGRVNVSLDQDKLDAAVNVRLEKIQQELREQLNLQHRAEIEEAVDKARLNWLKQLPEMQKKGAAVRESVGQLELLNSKLSAVTREKEQLEIKLIAEVHRRQENQTEIDSMRTELLAAQTAARSEDILRDEVEGLKRKMRGEEDRLRDELRTSLAKQQEQWQGILRNCRQETEEQRKMFNQRYEDEVGRLEERVKKSEEDRNEAENKLDKIETEYGLALKKWKRVLEDKNRIIDSLKSKGDIELLREELARRVEESENTRQEMAGMAQRWEQEVRSIQETHIKERKEFDEISDKYRCLKSKVRKYQRHVELKENHYKQEYNRLETEFKSTLERLRERMEQAYSAKEREVEQELGNMRDQFTQERNKKKLVSYGIMELKNIAGRNKEPKNMETFEDESLKRYYIKTTEEISQLLK